LPPSVTILGVEPASIATGCGLSPSVEAALAEAVSRARAIIAATYQRI